MISPITGFNANACLSGDRSIAAPPVALLLAVFICMFLTPIPTVAQKVTKLELTRELNQLDGEIPPLRARSSSLKDLSSKLSAATQTVAAANFEPLLGTLGKLDVDIQKYLDLDSSTSSGKHAPSRGSARSKTQTDLDLAWKSVEEGAASVAAELDKLVSLISQVNDLTRPQLTSSIEAGLGFVSEYLTRIGSEIALLNQARYEVRQYRRSAESFENFRLNVIPSLKKQLPTLQASLGGAIAAFNSRVTTEITSTSQALKAKEERQKELVQILGQREEGQQRTDTALLTYALPSFGVLLIALLMIPKLYAPASQRSIFQSGLLLELITVFLLTTTILLLGIAEKLTSEVLGTLIGGISGYVLGRWRQSDASSKGAQPVQQSEVGGDAVS